MSSIHLIHMKGGSKDLRKSFLADLVRQLFFVGEGALQQSPRVVRAFEMYLETHPSAFEFIQRIESASGVKDPLCMITFQSSSSTYTFFCRQSVLHRSTAFQKRKKGGKTVEFHLNFEGEIKRHDLKLLSRFLRMDKYSSSLFAPQRWELLMWFARQVGNRDLLDVVCINEVSTVNRDRVRAHSPVTFARCVELQRKYKFSIGESSLFALFGDVVEFHHQVGRTLFGERFVSFNRNQPFASQMECVRGLFETLGSRTVILRYSPVRSIPKEVTQALELSMVPVNLISITSCHIERLPCRLPSTLTELSLPGCRVRSVRAGDLPRSLKKLDLQANPLSQISGRFPPSLEELLLDQCALQKVPENLPMGLRRLSLSYNRIRVVGDFLPHALSHVNLLGNQLTRWRTQYFTEVTHLNLAGNRISVIKGRIPPLMEELDLTWNRLTRFPSRVPNSLRNLDLRYNWIQSVSFWPHRGLQVLL